MMTDKWTPQRPTLSSPSDSSSDAPVLDADVIQTLLELASDDDPDFFSDLIDQFLDDTQTSLATMRAAIAAHDATTMEQRAHSLKASSANVGALTMSELCRVLQEMGRADTTEGAEHYFAQLTHEFARVQEALTAEQAKLR
jgi:HPt (histidine-containing phosphotransfer) domain-containing protein